MTYRIDRRVFKEIRKYLLNLSHESIGVLQLAVVWCQPDMENELRSVGMYLSGKVSPGRAVAFPMIPDGLDMQARSDGECCRGAQLSRCS